MVGDLVHVPLHAITFIDDFGKITLVHFAVGAWLRSLACDSGGASGNDDMFAACRTRSAGEYAQSADELP